MPGVWSNRLRAFIPKGVLELLRSWGLTTWARRHVLGEVYYCSALQGDSNYNICINSDMSVSCNCRDFDGSGHIGDLNTQSLQEVFDGAVAMDFRNRLAEGELPIENCAECNELHRVSKREAQTRLKTYHVPDKGIMLENTVACNLSCIACDRTVVNTRSRKRMKLEEVARAADEIAKHKIEEIALHNLGEPFLSRSFYDEMCIIREKNPDARIVMSTNGTFVNDVKKMEAALLLDHLYCSIDGSNQEEMEQYQVGGDFELCYKNMCDLVAFRDERDSSTPLIEWKYVVFRWNDSAASIDRAVAMAREAGVDRISFWHGWGDSDIVSENFKTAPHFEALGESTWKGREVVFRS